MTTIINQIDMGFPKARGSLVHDPAHDAVEQTHPGMAHLAGTGPEGALCCQCRKWGVIEKRRVVPPQRYGFRKGTLRPGELYQGYCHKFVHGKRTQLFPGNAKACIFFDQRENPPVFKLSPHITKTKEKDTSQ